MVNTPLLIDWLTLRIGLGETLGLALTERIRSCCNTVHCVNSDGEMVWSKKALDIDALRSDTPGICWMMQSDGKQDYLVIGASPASLEHGCNVFGCLDIQHCAKVLIQRASKALDSVLPNYAFWQCQRVDITGNYVLPDAASVRQALRQLSLADGGRRRATTKKRGGDSVYWNPTSDLVKGKAYHKGPQMAYLRRKGLLEVTDDLISLGERLLRLEHTRAARFFRDLRKAGRNWWELTQEQLTNFYMEFFGPVTGGVEVREMERTELVKRIQDANGITEGRAQAAFTTYRNIRSDGFEVVRDYTAKATWFRHLRYLKIAGISASDLQQGNVVQFRPVRIILAQPVGSWDEIRRAA